MKHLLILLSILLLSSFLISCEEEKYVGEREMGNTMDGESSLFVMETSMWGSSRKGKNMVMGHLTLPGGTMYVGEFKDGESHDKGTLTWSDRTKYVGDWKDGERTGQGIYTFGNGKWEGDKYEGEFKDGKRNGQGTETLLDGRKYEGEWKDGKAWDLTIYGKNGNIIGKYVNEVLQK